jgi:hypothetical protein
MHVPNFPCVTGVEIHPSALRHPVIFYLQPELL